jgi:hypothetical protein
MARHDRRVSRYDIFILYLLIYECVNCKLAFTFRLTSAIFMTPHFLAGFSLMEVLISLLLLSFILLGFDATEVVALRTIRAAYYFDIANHQLNNMVERLYLINNDSDVLQQVAIWNAENKIVLPQGMGEVTGHFPVLTVTIYWGEMIHPCQENQFGNSGCLTENITLSL